MREHLDQLSAEALELILLDQFVEVRRETLEHEAEMTLVGEGIVHPENVVFVPRIVSRIELDYQFEGKGRAERTHQFQNGYFHFALIQICRLVFNDLDGEKLVRPHILAFYDLPKCTLT